MPSIRRTEVPALSAHLPRRYLLSTISNELQSPQSHAELLAAKLAAMPPPQLDALEQAINGCMGYAATLMSWMRDLVRWETVRRNRRTPRHASPAPPRAAELDVGAAVVTLSVLTAIFQTASPTAASDFQPTIELLDAIRQSLSVWASGEGGPLH